ncbi:MAG TPA: FtsQ-type POTRA domain-containing protein [Acidimicrobiia bacterium]|nr:FtsQ-type POTRA domain-containing protein [Acidimicrobiia bacterium]
MSAGTTQRAPRPPVDPRIRARWIAARRAEGRRRLKVAVVITSVVLIGVAVWVVLASPLLDVDRVVVRGAHRSTAQEIRSAAGIDRGDPMVWVDGGAAASRVDALPWVRTAQVRRDWPGTVTITVTERAPVAWVDRAGAVALVDGTGRVLERVVSAPADLPHVVGVQRVPPAGAPIVPVAGAEVAARLVGYARTGTRTITVTRAGVSLGLASGPEIRLGAPSRVMTKVNAAVAVLTALGGAPVGYVDVTVPSNPVAGPPG